MDNNHVTDSGNSREGDSTAGDEHDNCSEIEEAGIRPSSSPRHSATSEDDHDNGKPSDVSVIEKNMKEGESTSKGLVLVPVNDDSSKNRKMMVSKFPLRPNMSTDDHPSFEPSFANGTPSSGSTEKDTNKDRNPEKGLVLRPAATSSDDQDRKKLPLRRREWRVNRSSIDESSPDSNSNAVVEPPSLARQRNGITRPPSLPTRNRAVRQLPLAPNNTSQTQHGAYRVTHYRSTAIAHDESSLSHSNTSADGGDSFDTSSEAAGDEENNHIVQGVLASNIIHAEVIEYKDDDEEAHQRMGLQRADYLVAATAVIIIGLVIGVWLGLRKDDPPTPASSPSMSPVAVSEALPEWIQQYSPWTSFEDPESAQSRALEWTLTDELSLSLFESDNLLLLERFALAVLTYATNSDNSLVEAADAACLAGNISGALFTCDEDGYLTDIVDFGNDIIATLPPEISLLTRLSSFRWTGALEWSGTIPSQIGLMESLREVDFCTLTWSKEGLTGPVPSEIGNLKRLDSLCLDGHAFDYPLPTSFWQLPNLKGGKVQFDSTGFDGAAFPSDVGQLTALTELIDLHPRHMFTGSIPTEIGLLSDLEIFNIKWSMLGTLPSELGRLSRLKDFDVSYHLGLGGTLPTEVGKMSALERFVVKNTLLTGNVPSEMGLLTGLTELSITATDHPNLTTFAGVLPTEITSQLTNLEKFNLQGTGVSVLITSEIGRLSNLSYFRIDRKLIDDGRGQSLSLLPSEIGLLTNLELLVLRKIFLLLTLPLEIGRLQKLRVLDVSSNALDGPIPTEILSIPELYHLDVSDMEHFRDLSIPSEIGLFASTLLSPISNKFEEYDKVFLGMSRTQFSGTIPTEIGQSRELQILNMDGNAFSGLVPFELGLLPKLESLQIGNSVGSLTKWGPFPVLSSLTALRINDMGLASFPTFIYDLPNLEELDISGNDLVSGSIPIELASLTTLEKLSLSAVGATGSIIPTEFGSLQELTSLDLARNDFDGGVPSELGLLTYLYSLDFRSASLSGSLPTELLMLRSLNELHLEDNPDLTGSVPEGFSSLQMLENLFLQGTELTGNNIDCLKLLPQPAPLPVYPSSGSTSLFRNITFTAVVDCENFVDCTCCVNGNNNNTYFNETC